MTLHEQNYFCNCCAALAVFSSKLTSAYVDVQTTCTGIIAAEIVLQRNIAELAPAEVFQVIVQSAGVRDYLYAVVQASVVLAVDVLGCFAKLTCGFFGVFAFGYLKLKTEN